MLVTFQSNVGRVTMFGDIAVQLIRMMGRSGTVPSALLAADIPEALATLQDALDIVKDGPVESTTEAEDEKDKKSSVSWRHRALPLIKLLEDAVKHGSDVMWERQGSSGL